MVTFHGNMFHAARRRIRGRYLRWYYGSRLVVGTLRGAELGVLHSFMGSSPAVMMLEELIACGARQVVEVGLCGGLGSDTRVGDVIVASEAFVDEGTSSHYFDNPKMFSASDRITEAIKGALADAGLAFKFGGIWTTDAPYRETRAKLREFEKLGAVGVNMETSALLAIAEYRGIEVGSIQVVSDLLGKRNWKPAFHERIVSERSIKAARVALDALLRS
jgi:uridine phosphorylase